MDGQMTIYCNYVYTYSHLVRMQLYTQEFRLEVKICCCYGYIYSKSNLHMYIHIIYSSISTILYRIIINNYMMIDILLVKLISGDS